MKKNDLIEMLSKIDGNPEIKLWNGYVGDYMDLGEVVPSNIVKMRFEFFLEMCRLEHCMDTGADRKTYTFTHEEIVELRKNYKDNYGWEFNEYVTEEDIKSKKYSSKTIMILNAKTRGKKTFDRIGVLEY
jgi:hypothetical protein